jgi:hypothetical protein
VGPRDGEGSGRRVLGLVRPAEGTREGRRARAEYYNHRAAWEETDSERFHIGYTGNGRLQPVWLFTDPSCLWFVLPHQDTYGEGHSIGPPLFFTGDDVGFDLRVVNESREVAKEWRLTLLFADGALSDVGCIPQ